MGTKLSDEEVVGGGLERIAELIACMVPFVSVAPLAARDHGPPWFTPDGTTGGVDA